MHYHIRVKGHLAGNWAAWFDPLTIINTANGETVLSGDLPDQTALHGILMKVRDLGLLLIAVQQTPPPGEARPRGG